MFENKLPTGIFGTKTEEETKRCRKFLKEMLHNLYSSPNGDIRTIKWRMIWRVQHGRN